MKQISIWNFCSQNRSSVLKVARLILFKTKNLWYKMRSLRETEILLPKQKFKFRTSVSEAEIANRILFRGGTSSYDRSSLLVAELVWQLLILNFCFRSRNFNLKSVLRRDVVFYRKLCALNRISPATFSPELLFGRRNFKHHRRRLITRTKITEVQD